MPLIYPSEDYDIVYSTNGRNFYVGADPDSYEYLPENVGVVVSCCEKSYPGPPNLGIWHFYFPDSWYERELPTRSWLDVRLVGIKYALEAKPGKDLFVHCSAGMNRSAFFVAMYLKKFHFDEFKDAQEIIDKLREKRSPLLQNSFFEKMICTGRYT